MFRKTGLLLIFMVITSLFFYKLALTNLTLARGDTFAYFYPYWDARDEALSKGKLPLWTTDLYMGAPLLANPQLGTLYPPNWLTISLPAPDAIRVSVLLHVFCAVIGTYLLARRALYVGQLAAFTAGVTFGFGGYVGAHIEQINQLQGLAWMPWLFLLFHLSIKKRTLYLPLLGVTWGLQVLSGHSQVAFISGIGLGIYTLVYAVMQRSFKSFLHCLLGLIIAAIIGMIVAAPQLIPSQELSVLSNRSDGLNPQEATAFSLNIFLFGRGMLPSYDSQPFSEYIAYVGVFGLGLMTIGALSSNHHRWGWLILAFAGVFLALGRNNPLYLPLASLPGFNLFRVPARWLALYALGGALLSGLGIQTLLQYSWNRNHTHHISQVISIGVVVLLIASTFLSDRAADEIDGQALPTTLSLVGWSVALLGFVILGRLVLMHHRFLLLLVVLTTAELWFAARFLPHDDLSDPTIYEYPRFTTHLMQVFNEDQKPPGRVLSISRLLFNTSDKATLKSHWNQINISQRGTTHAFTATKLQEILAPNLPLKWDIPSVDGFGGGLLPTLYYTQFTSLLLPQNTRRAVDGRLREMLAQPECRGACLPEARWLDLMNVQYLLIDKVYDLVHEGIFYDTGFLINIDPATPLRLTDVHRFQNDGFHVLYTCKDAPVCQAPTIVVESDDHSATLQQTKENNIILDDLLMARYTTQEPLIPQEIAMHSTVPITIHAMTLVDHRTGDFLQLTPPDWKRVYSADVKIYKNLDVMPRVFIVHEALLLPDTYAGSEQALTIMRDPNFNPRQTVIVHTNQTEIQPITAETHAQTASVTLIGYADTGLTAEVMTSAPGFLVITDAYYPGWQASIDGKPTSIYRADVMFRAIPVAAGQHKITLEYHPPSILGLVGSISGH